MHLFKTDDGYNTYAIEMLINVIQNDVLLSEPEVDQCTWAATANWRGGQNKNMKIDLYQENCNADLKN